MKPFTYLLIDLGCILIPFIASFYPKHSFIKAWKYFFPANILVGLFFIIWDSYFTKWGVWGFNPDYLTGVQLFNLPIEEILFFFCIPYACVFTYFAFTHLFVKNPLHKIQKVITLILIFILVFGSVYFFDRWYTFLTFSLTSIYLMYKVFQKQDLSDIYRAFLCIIPFFFISNGILTGSIIESPVVWYNDLENIGIRIFTIPIEDSIYGFLLIALNIDLYIFFKNKNEGLILKQAMENGK